MKAILCCVWQTVNQDSELNCFKLQVHNNLGTLGLITLISSMRPWSACAGVGKMTWLIDFEGYSYRNAPPISMAMKALNILQNHYPERLGLAVCYHPPRLFQLTWRVSPKASSSPSLNLMIAVCCGPMHACKTLYLWHMMYKAVGSL